MNKRFFLGGILLVIVAAAAALVVNRRLDQAVTLPAITDHELSRIASNANGVPQMPGVTPLAAIPATQAVRLAIGSLGLADDERNAQVADLLTAELTSTTGLQLVERQNFDKVLHEMQLSLSGLVRAKDAVKVGKLLKADWFLLGTDSVVNGTNVIVVRIVDARTGVLRDAAMVASSESATQLAFELAAFLRRSRQEAANPRTKTYLAIGSFEDLSLNSRQATLPQDIRSYLIADYQGGSSTMLEREFVATLLQEVNLDLAGLTESNGANTPNPMQAAYWMVDGYYQSYETTNLQVELVLNVRRMFGRRQKLELRDQAGESLFRRAKAGIDQAMARNQGAVAVGRVTELQSQMDTGKELATAVLPKPFSDWSLTWPENYQTRSDNEMARRLRNTQEAIRAFQTVLLLDPTNREARMYLAACFRLSMIGKVEEARDIYRELIESPVEDSWSSVARQALVESFRWHSPEAKQHWFENAAQLSAKPAAKEFFQRRAHKAAEDVALKNGGTNVHALAEGRLFEAIQSFDNALHGKNGVFSSAIGMDAFASALGKDRPLIARRLAELFPQIKTKFPDSSPYVLATIVSYQADTNAPIIAEFVRTLDWAAENPDKIVNEGTSFWNHIRYTPHEWARKQKANQLTTKILETLFRVSNQGPKGSGREFGDEDKMALAFAYLADERWTDALGIFESYTNRPLYMGNGGPWGPAFTVILTSKQAALCRQKLSMPPVVDPREFDLGEPCLRLHPEENFGHRFEASTPLVASSGGLWLGLAGDLVHLDFDLKTNFCARMPIPTGSAARISTLLIGTTNAWIGTSGAGLIEFNTATRTYRHLTEKDGLFMDYISSLLVVGNVLWIGYGNESGGGLGRLELSTGRFRAFTAPLSSSGDVIAPPRKMVTQVLAGLEGNIWFMANSQLRKYRTADDSWEVLPGPPSVGYAMDNRRLVNALNTGGLEIRDVQSGPFRRLLERNSLPGRPTTLTLEGNRLWVGGQGFVAVLDLDSAKLTKVAYIPARTVDKIELGGGYAWVQFEKQIYRTKL
jgi:tetratricopeptide (TPR) repeat protein